MIYSIVWSQVNIEPIGDPGEEGTQDMVVKVREMDGGRFDYGIGYGTAVMNPFTVLVAQFKPGRQSPDALFIVLGVFRIGVVVRSRHEFEARGAGKPNYSFF